MDLKDRTKLFAIGIIKFVQSLPEDKVTRRIADQLLRSGTSVGANTRASFRARSKKEYVAKTGIVVEEADECLFWFEILEESELVSSNEITILKKEAEELLAIFVSVYQKNKKEL